jgi:hypothetical protein
MLIEDAAAEGVGRPAAPSTARWRQALPVRVSTPSVVGDNRLPNRQRRRVGVADANIPTKGSRQQKNFDVPLDA